MKISKQYEQSLLKTNSDDLTYSDEENLNKRKNNSNFMNQQHINKEDCHKRIKEGSSIYFFNFIEYNRNKASSDLDNEKCPESLLLYSSLYKYF